MLYRRSRSARGDEPATGIALSPLIDCVFLLLIFFLVTTMLKRKETIIPVTIPDAASALDATARETVTLIGLDTNGNFLQPAGRDRYGATTYQPGGDLDAYLRSLIERQGDAVRRQPVRLDVARLTPFQRTIDALDTIKQQGFTNVSVKLHPPATPP